jgi:hypothetical protein
MTFSPDSPASPNDLYATFAIDGHLTGLLYNSDQGIYSRIMGEWEVMGRDNDPVNQGAYIVFVDPSFIPEFDARMLYGEFLSKGVVKEQFGVEPNFNK